MAQESFYVLAGARAALLQTISAVTDDDLFLRRALDEDGAMDAREILPLFIELLRDDRRHVGNLIAHCLQNLLAHDLRNEQPQGLIGQLVLVKDGLARSEEHTSELQS